MNNISKSRKLFDKKSGEIYKNLSKSIFKDYDLLDVFSIAMIIGKKRGIKANMGKNEAGEVNKYTMENKKTFLPLITCFAIANENSMDLITDEVRCFEICEAYAKSGLEILEIEQMSKSNEELLTDFENEILEFYDTIN
ncbi:MAG: hypothetical protein KO202_02140 [Methanobacteriaceae archaeon]|jgi:hypothetical protein|nr:hypothetical protein [Methanobacteriaceae archaeon]